MNVLNSCKLKTVSKDFERNNYVSFIPFPLSLHCICFSKIQTHLINLPLQANTFPDRALLSPDIPRARSLQFPFKHSSQEDGRVSCRGEPTEAGDGLSAVTISLLQIRVTGTFFTKLTPSRGIFVWIHLSPSFHLFGLFFVLFTLSIGKVRVHTTTCPL